MGASRTSASKPRSDVLRAVIWMSGSVVSFIVMAVAGRQAGLRLDTFEIMAFRSLFGVLIMVAVLTAFGLWPRVKARRMGLHAVRNLSHFTGQNLWFYALTSIPLAQVFALEFTSPLWVLVLSPLILGERLTKMRALSAVIGFAGVLLVARPGAVPISTGVIFAALAAIGFAGSITTTKLLTRTESTPSILFWLTVMQAVMGFACAFADGAMALPAGQEWLLLAVIGCCGLMGHFCLTSALSFAPATIVVPIDFARLPGVAVVAAILYGETLDPFVLLGALVIFGGNYLNIWTETRARRAAPPVAPPA
ncbi:DMT family transporter [Pseudooceanicola sp. 502str34]